MGDIHDVNTLVNTRDTQGGATQADVTLEDAASAVGAWLRRDPAAPVVERYHTRQELGAGGMGRVLLAEDKALMRPVAMKVLHRAGDPASDEHQRKRFSREAGIAGRLEHPNIVPVYDAGVDDNGAPYMTMRYVEGVTLRVIIDRLRAGDAETVRAWPLEARCRVVMQLLSALSLAHARGVLHRDIKPDNVMIGPFGEVFLVDWGIACAPEESAADERGVVGTVAYMSPEQAEGKELDARSDLYALSVLFYELLTLRHPCGDLPRATMPQLLAAQSRPMLAAEHVRTKGNTVVPRALSLVVMQGLERDRDKRFPSASAMEAAVQAHLAGQAPVVCPHTAYARGLSFLGHVLDAWPRFTIVLTLATVSLALVGALFIVATLLDVLSA